MVMYRSGMETHSHLPIGTPVRDGDLHGRVTERLTTRGHREITITDDQGKTRVYADGEIDRLEVVQP